MADVGTKPQNSDQLAFDIIWDFDIGIWCLLFRNSQFTAELAESAEKVRKQEIR